MVWLLTHSLREQLKAVADFWLTRTATTEELQLRTSCDIISLRVKEVQEGFFGPLFFYLNKIYSTMD